MADHGAPSSRFSDRRAWVLQDTRCYLGCRRNETTAAAWTSTGHAVEVSVVLADPPGISRCFIHCDGLTAEQFTEEPRVISAEGAFLLLRMTFSPSTDVKPVNDVFVYRAGPGKPSLYLLPHTFPPLPLHSTSIAILPSESDGEHFSVVIPSGWFNRHPLRYNLHIFSSSSKLWTTKQIAVSSDAETCSRNLVCHQTAKVISLGGGSLGWVDLSRGILTCDMLCDEPVMRLMQFPELEPSKRLYPGRRVIQAYARAIRDVTCTDGVVRFVEIEHRRNGDGIEGYAGWVATMWRREVSSADWVPCLKFDSSDVSATSSSLSCLLPEMCDTDTNKLNLNKVITTCPTLGLLDDGVLYMMSKLNPVHPRTFVLAINTKSKTLEGVTEVSSERIYIEPPYPCIFPNHISLVPGTEMANPQTSTWWTEMANPQTSTWEKMEPVETDLTAVIHRLKEIEKIFNNQEAKYERGFLSLCSAVRFRAEQFSSNGQREGASGTVDEGRRLAEDLIVAAFGPIISMREKIRGVVDTLHNLKRTLGVEGESRGPVQKC